MPLKRPESILVVLHDENANVLVLQRKDDPDFWQSVTGTMEEGETPLETALREVKEETGIDLHQQHGISEQVMVNEFDIRPQWRHRYAPNTFRNTEYAFTAQIDRYSSIVMTEHLAYEWLSKADALARLWSPSNKAVVEQFVHLPGGEQSTQSIARLPDGARD